eukprot:5758577-Amphidinium_carterae.3
MGAEVSDMESLFKIDFGEVTSKSYLVVGAWLGGGALCEESPTVIAACRVTCADPVNHRSAARSSLSALYSSKSHDSKTVQS